MMHLGISSSNQVISVPNWSPKSNRFKAQRSVPRGDKVSPNHVHKLKSKKAQNYNRFRQKTWPKDAENKQIWRPQKMPKCDHKLSLVGPETRPSSSPNRVQ